MTSKYVPWDRNNPMVPFYVYGQWTRNGNEREFIPNSYQPYDTMLSQASRYNHNYEFRSLPDFTACLTLKDMNSERSIWVDEATGVAYPIAFSGVKRIVTDCVLTYGKTDEQTWTAYKIGTHYFIKLI